MSITSDLFNQQVELMRRFEGATNSEKRLLAQLCLQEHLNLHRLILIADAKRITPVKISTRSLMPQSTTQDLDPYFKFFAATRHLVVAIASMVDAGHFSTAVSRRLRIALIEIGSLTDVKLTKINKAKKR